MKLLIIDDDHTYLSILQRRIQQTGEFTVSTFTSAQAALNAPEEQVFAILLDMQLGQKSGLDAIEPLKQRFNPQHLIMLTGYASIVTTVEAMRRGATDYLAKPVSLKDILARLQGEKYSSPPLKPLTPAQVEWEHIQRVLHEHSGNISATAAALSMHRRTLQRKLKKHIQVISR